MRCLINAAKQDKITKCSTSAALSTIPLPSPFGTCWIPLASSEMSQLTYTTPNRQFKDHESTVTAVAVFPDRQHMITGSKDKTLRLWDLKTGVVLKKMVGHSNGVRALAVSLDGQLLASGDGSGEVITWDRESLAWVTQASIKAHSSLIYTLNFSPDGTVLATGSSDSTTKLWNTKTRLLQGHQITCSGPVLCVRYSPSGALLAIATQSNIEIYHPDTSNSLQDSRATPNLTYHSCGRPTVRTLFQGEILKIPAYESGMHRPGRRSVVSGLVILTVSVPLPSILLVHSSRPHLMTTMSTSGRCWIGKPSPSSCTPAQRDASPSRWMGSIFSVVILISKSQSGQYPKIFYRRIPVRTRQQRLNALI